MPIHDVLQPGDEPPGGGEAGVGVKNKHDVDEYGSNTANDRNTSQHPNAGNVDLTAAMALLERHARDYNGIPDVPSAYVITDREVESFRIRDERARGDLEFAIAWTHIAPAQLSLSPFLTYGALGMKPVTATYTPATNVVGIATDFSLSAELGKSLSSNPLSACYGVELAYHAEKSTGLFFGLWVECNVEVGPVIGGISSDGDVSLAFKTCAELLPAPKIRFSCSVKASQGTSNPIYKPEKKDKLR